MSALSSQFDPQGPAAVFHGSTGDAPAGSNSSASISPVRPAKNARWSGREWRVATLIAMIVLVSLADLYLTMTYLHNGGMAEGNPVARWVMSLGMPWLLVAWKVSMVIFTCSILFAFKKRGTTEVAAWVCCIAMGWLTVQWSVYVHDIAGELRSNPQLTQVSSWVSFDRN
jgi:hypothetical protein